MRDVDGVITSSGMSFIPSCVTVVTPVQSEAGAKACSAPAGGHLESLKAEALADQIEESLTAAAQNLMTRQDHLKEHSVAAFICPERELTLHSGRFFRIAGRF